MVDFYYGIIGSDNKRFRSGNDGKVFVFEVMCYEVFVFGFFYIRELEVMFVKSVNMFVKYYGSVVQEREGWFKLGDNVFIYLDKLSEKEMFVVQLF